MSEDIPEYPYELFQNATEDPKLKNKLKGNRNSQKEAVNHPSHYNAGSIEVIDAIEDWDLGFHEGNVVKYVARAKHKGKELEDLKKARWYLERKIQELENK